MLDLSKSALHELLHSCSLQRENHLMNDPISYVFLEACFSSETLYVVNVMHLPSYVLLREIIWECSILVRLAGFAIQLRSESESLGCCLGSRLPQDSLVFFELWSSAFEGRSALQSNLSSVDSLGKLLILSGENRSALISKHSSLFKISLLYYLKLGAGLVERRDLLVQSHSPHEED
ncbi:hypothetical protein Tco_1121555 [Tanacetum coccineum]|uniref:Uncharacterized protein n=1 Tax=Tanacetum coccineum TaxID=301880 RepID=A0ABQ5IZE2_9ASTR